MRLRFLLSIEYKTINNDSLRFIGDKRILIDLFFYIYPVPDFIMKQLLKSLPGKRNSKIAVLITMLCLSISFRCNAQGYLEGANLSDEFMPLQVKDSKTDKAFYGNNLQLNDLLPVFLKKDKSQMLLVGLNLESLSFSGSHPDFPVPNLYSIAPVVGYGRKINKHLFLSAMLIPVFNTDMSEVSGSDIHVGGVVHGSYRITDDLSVKLTLGCIKEYYGIQYVALFGFDWKITERWRLFGDMPIYGTLSYRINPKINAGLNYTGISTSYHAAEQNEYFEFTATQLGVFAEYYLTSMLAVRATVAYSTERYMELYNINNKTTGGGIIYVDDGPHTTPLYPQVDNGPIYKLSLSLRFPEPKNK